MCCLEPVPPQLHSPTLDPLVPIWDAHMHVHCLPGHRWDSPPERALALMDAVGIEKAVIMPYSEIGRHNKQELLVGKQYADAFPGRFLLFARLHPGAKGAEDLLEWAVQDLGYVGLKLHPVGSRIAPNDPRTVALAKKAETLHVPVLFHCGDEPLTLPDDIGPLAEKVPDVPILLGHCGGYRHVDSALRWAKRCSNLYLETSATPDITSLLRGFDSLGPSRFIWGSDGPGCLPYLEVKKMLVLTEKFQSHRREIFRDNFRSLLPQRKDSHASGV